MRKCELLVGVLVWARPLTRAPQILGTGPHILHLITPPAIPSWDGLVATWLNSLCWRLLIYIFSSDFDCVYDIHIHSRALARISELGVQKRNLGWTGCPIPFHPIALYTKSMDIKVSKLSDSVSKRHTNTPLANGMIHSNYHKFVRWSLP